VRRAARRASLALALGVALALPVPRPADAFSLRSAPPGNRLPMNLNLPATPFQTLGYDTQSYRTLTEMTLDAWNQVGVGDPADHAFFSVRVPTVVGDPCNRDGVNEVRFAPTFCGLQWGSTIGVTQFYIIGGEVVETDVVFNQTVELDAYPGPLVPAAGGGTLIDFVRLALHEFGHALGLGHPDQAGQVVFAVMNSVIGDADQLQPDDIAGAHAVNWSAPAGEVALTIDRAGAGSGTVTSSPAGISCGTTCTAQYPSGTQVTLAAAAAQGSVFAGWSGGGCAGTGPCVVTLTATTTVTATFSPGGATFALTVDRTGAGSGTVTSAPAGIACGITCAAAFPSGAVVTLSAAAAQGSEFAGWSGGGCGGTGVCTVTLTADVAVTATFTPIAPGATFALSVSRSGTGSGTVTSFPPGIDCGATCAAAYPVGTVVALTAVPAAGTVFAGWLGTCAGAGSCLVSMTADRSVTARFEVSTNLQPVITSPGDGTTLTLIGPTPVAFAWTAVAGAARYFLEYSGPGLDFTNPNGTTRDMVNGSGGAGGGFFAPSASQVIVVDPATPPGRYRVRVIGVVATGGFIGTFSDAITLVVGQVTGGQVTILAPAPGTVVARGTAVSFAWTALPGVTLYGLEFTGPDLTFANPNGAAPDAVNGFGGAGGGVLVGGTGLTVVVPADLAPGAYAVRVIGLSAAGLPLGTFSDAITLVIQ
jgi:hypothetical protein